MDNKLTKYALSVGFFGVLLIAILAVAGVLPVEDKEAIQSDNDVVESDSAENTESENEKDADESVIEEQIYSVAFQALWNKEEHINIPEGPHFSPFAAWTYMKEGEDPIFEIGGVASDGIELMAETGGVDILKQELDKAKEDGLIGDYVIGERVDSPGEAVRELAVSGKYGYASVVSMLAPTPDWFAAVQDIALMDEDGFVEAVGIAMRVYDAGTDSGALFNSEDEDTQPRGVIRSLKEEEGIDLEEGGGSAAQVSFTPAVEE